MWSWSEDGGRRRIRVGSICWIQRRSCSHLRQAYLSHRTFNSLLFCFHINSSSSSFNLRLISSINWHHLIYVLNRKQLIKYGLVVLFNVTMWGCYVNSLKALSSLQATVTNFATNFITSGLAGFFFFHESLSFQVITTIIFLFNCNIYTLLYPILFSYSMINPNWRNKFEMEPKWLPLVLSFNKISLFIHYML